MKRLGIGLAICAILAACSDGSSLAPETATPQRQSPVVAGNSNKSQLNAIRAKAGVPAVTRNPDLDAAALAHATDMNSKAFFGHEGSNGSTVGKRVKRAGYRWCTVAENIAEGYPNRAVVMERWRTSPGHYRNMTKRKVKEFGMARVGDVWVMVLAAKRC